jgi:hypothetical protein
VDFGAGRFLGGVRSWRRHAPASAIDAAGEFGYTAIIPIAVPMFEKQMSQQTDHQAPERRGKPGNPNWLPGISGNGRGRLSVAEWRALVEAKVAELAAEYGGVERLSAIERVMVEQAAVLLLRRPRRGEDPVRKANVVARLLGHLKHKRQRAPASGPTFAETLARYGPSAK